MLDLINGKFMEIDNIICNLEAFIGIIGLLVYAFILFLILLFGDSFIYSMMVDLWGFFYCRLSIELLTNS
jgi:hypothetical protein